MTQATAEALPRLLVFETPGVAELASTLGNLFPGTEIDMRTTYDLGGHAPDLDALSVWHIASGASRIEEEAADLLRHLFYPLATRRCPFVVSFELGQEAFLPAALPLTGVEGLDLEDIFKLLAPDSAQVQSFDRLHLLGTQLPQTPIETALAAALQAQGIEAKRQSRVGKFIVDFLVERDGRKWAVEADGQAFHDPDQDALRDEALAQLGIERVVRFTGSEIHRDAEACARRVKEAISGETRARTRIREQRLDEGQKRASTHSSGAARVLAPAGAGKTRVLVERIAELVRGGAEPSSILALAFNKKANDQLVNRLEELGVATSPNRLFDDSVDGVRCATFNAFGYRFQQEHLGLRFELEDSQLEWRGLMGRAAQKAGVTFNKTKRGSDPIGELLRARERAGADLVDPDEIEVEFETFDDNSSTIIQYGEIDREFERMRVDRQIQSFSDMLTTTVHQLLGSPQSRAFVQEYFTHVFVDEFQDLNAAQLAIVDIVSRPSRDLFVVGDDDQLIYGWRYAKLTNILEFEDRIPGAKTFVLSTNYRSSAAVVESARRLIDHNKVRIPKDIKPRVGAPVGEVRYVSASSLGARSQEVTTFIEGAKERCGEWRKIAVLCRNKAQQPSVAAALDSAGIPRSPLLSYRLFSDPNMKVLRSYLALIRSPESLVGGSLATIVNRPNRFATKQLLDEIRSWEAPWPDFCQYLDDSPEEDAYRTKALRGFRDRVRILQRKFSNELITPEELVNEVIREFDLERYWRDEKPNRNRDQDEGSPIALLDLIRLHARESSGTGIDSFLAAWDQRAADEIGKTDSAADDLAREDSPEQDRVVISTIHASKGREYEAVVIFDYDADLGNLTEQQIEEERRVFYVGMTRAEDSLLITVDSNKPLHKFVRESIAPATLEESLEIREQQAKIDERRRQATIDLARANDRLVEITDGRKLSQLEQELAEERQRRAKLMAELTEHRTRLDGARVWHAISGRKRQIEQVIFELEESLAACEAKESRLDDEVTFLRADSSRYAEPHEREAGAAARRLSDLDRDALSLIDRLNQLELIGDWASQGSSLV